MASLPRPPPNNFFPLFFFPRISAKEQALPLKGPREVINTGGILGILLPSARDAVVRVRLLMESNTSRSASRSNLSSSDNASIKSIASPAAASLSSERCLISLRQVSGCAAASSIKSPDVRSSRNQKRSCCGVGFVAMLEIVGFDKSANHRPILVALSFLRFHQIGQRHQLVGGTVFREQG